MQEHRETKMISKALSRTQAIGRVFFVVFAICALFFLLLLIASFVFAILGSSDILSSLLILLPGIVQYIAMGSTFALCSLVAWGVSRENTPFSKKQIRRILVSGLIMLGYTVFCLLYPVAFASFHLESIGLSLEIYPSVEPGDLNINFETLIAACSFFFFAYILGYGRTLQELNDEIL